MRQNYKKDEASSKVTKGETIKRKKSIVPNIGVKWWS